jgi:poly-gamma-glutamate synthesis protein (capsule biosynthesis protein)
MPVILATGDVAPDRDHADECFEGLRDRLNAADLVIGQLETSFSAVGTRLPQARHAVLAAPEAAGAVGRAGFDIISCAGNHCLDWGREALLETMANLRAAGVEVVGAGKDIHAARQPVLRRLPDGTRVAVLAYSSILPMAYWADERRPGCVPMRAHTLYEAIEPDQPGTLPRTRSFPHRDDLKAMQQDIEAARAIADAVLVSHHWGIHFVRNVIADYQRDVARAAIAAGADAIIGHHAHILKGAEIIDGKPVFYSLCNFATDLRMDEAHAASKSFQEIRVLAEEWEPDFDSLYNFPAAARMSIMVRLDVADGQVRNAGFVPLWIDRDAVPRAIPPGDPRFGEVVDYMTAVTKEAGLNARYRPAGDHVLMEQG